MHFGDPNIVPEGFKQRPTFDTPPDLETRRGFLRKAIGAAIGTAGLSMLVRHPDFDIEKDAEEKSIVKKAEREDENIAEENIEEAPATLESAEERELIKWTELKKLKPDIKYAEIAPRLQIENLQMPDDVGKYGASTHIGKILRTLRYKNVTDAVEKRYNLPSGILLAMIMEESTGVDLLPNARGDGGFGLCHMQGSTAKEFGLKTYCGCDSIVCNGKDGRSCKWPNGKLKDHAGELAKFMVNNKSNRKKLVNEDERLNILLNIDAAGRMIASGISGPKLRGKLANLGPLQSAIARYAGAYNYEKYWKDIRRNVNDLTNPQILKKVAEIFEKKNSRLRINGEKADFDEYMKNVREQNLNYGLEEYEGLTKYLPKNSEIVRRSYDESLTA